MALWFRLYDNILYSSKVQKLSPQLFKLWINLLAMASSNDPRGKLPENYDEIAFKLHRSDGALLKKQLEELKKRLLLEKVNETYEIHDWENWQRKSDRDLNSAERKRRERNNSSEKSCHGNVTEMSRKGHENRQDRERQKDIQTFCLSLLNQSSEGGYLQTYFYSQPIKSDDGKINMLRKEIVDTGSGLGISGEEAEIIFISKINELKNGEQQFWKTQAITADNLLNKKIFERVWGTVDNEFIDEIRRCMEEGRSNEEVKKKALEVLQKSPKLQEIKKGRGN